MTPIAPHSPKAWRPGILLVLVVVSLLVVLLPVAGVGVLRIYDTELIRQTEAELIGQAAFTDAAYRQALLEAFARDGVAPTEYGHDAEVYTPPELSEDGERQFRPVLLELDIRDEAYFRPPWDEDGRAPTAPAHPAAISAGERVQQQVRQAMEVTLFGMRLVDPNGVVVATSVDELGLDISHREEVKRALRGETVHLLREKASNDGPPGLDTLSRSTNVRVFFAMPILLERRVLGAVVFSRTPVSLEKALYRNSDTFIGLAALVLGIAILIAVLASFAVVIPVRRLVRQVRAIEHGEADDFEPIGRPVTREVAELSTSIAGMANTLSRRAHYIRHFARSVSHEFKTPLASMRGTIELLEDHFESMPPEKRQRFLRMLEKDTGRLTRLVDGLHELARADVSKPTGESVDAVAVARTVAERHALELAAKRAPMPVAASEEVVDTVLSNLVTNALRYGAPPVSIHVHGHDHDVEIRVTDRGEGISEGNREKIFDEFFTTGRKEGGTGLGLPIVKALVEAHGGTIALAENDGLTAFIVRLPRA